VIGAGSTISVSFEDPAVLTTLPATVTGADDVVLSAGVLLPEHAASAVSAVSTVNEWTMATAALRGRVGWADGLRLMQQVRTARCLISQSVPGL